LDRQHPEIFMKLRWSIFDVLHNDANDLAVSCIGRDTETNTCKPRPFDNTNATTHCKPAGVANAIFIDLSYEGAAVWQQLVC
jgi:hypothetical protein